MDCSCPVICKYLLTTQVLSQPLPETTRLLFQLFLLFCICPLFPPHIDILLTCILFNHLAKNIKMLKKSHFHIRPFSFSNYCTFYKYILPPVIQCGLHYFYSAYYILLHNLLHIVLYKPAQPFFVTSVACTSIEVCTKHRSLTSGDTLHLGYFRISHSLLTYILPGEHNH